MSTYTKVSIDRRIGKRAANAFDLIGKRFGRVQVIAQSENFVGNSGWVCFCDCGTWKKIRGVSLTKGITSSCGCLHRERTGEAMRTHGLTKSVEYRAWRHAKSRCYNPNVHNYSRYGGRGVKMCERWLNSFENFLADMGPRPSGNHSIDRFPKLDGDYEPGNCQWGTQEDQVDHKENRLRYTFKGRTMTLKAWAIEIGHPYKDLHKRIHFRKWSVEKAFTTPKKKWGGR